MGLFGKKKELTELALEEARRFDAADAKDGSAATTQGETVSVTTVRHVGADDPQVKDALAAFGFGPEVLQQVQSMGAQKPDPGFSAALDAIERDYRGKPPAEAKAAIEAALKEHHHTMPDMVVDLLAKGVSEGTTIDVQFGGSPQAPPE